MRSVRAAILSLFAALALSSTGHYVVPIGASLSPGDTPFVGERWF
jgi:hypothetical protein